MEKRSVEIIVEALNAASVRYLIAGGLAVVAHGLIRFTADVDMVLDPSPEALRRAIDALSGLGYRPRAPVQFSEFANAEARARWAREKDLKVFSVFSSQHAATEIDLFLESPFDFEQAFPRARRLELAPGVVATFVALDDLIQMKRAAGRALDLQDIDGLQALNKRRATRDG
jgi:hypothetical protein